MYGVRRKVNKQAITFNLFVSLCVQSLSRVWLLATPWTTYTGLACPSPSPGACSCPWSRRCYPTISSSADPFSSCLQSFPASGSFPMSWLFSSGGQSIRASALASVLPMNIQDWFPLGLTGLIPLRTPWAYTLVYPVKSLMGKKKYTQVNGKFLVAHLNWL